VVCTVSGDPPPGFVTIGEVVAGSKVKVTAAGRDIAVSQSGWRHV
jgi:hypothetical protein